MSDELHNDGKPVELAAPRKFFCGACRAELDPGVFHICAGNAHHHGIDTATLPPLPPPLEAQCEPAFMSGDPPAVTETKDRSTCTACGGPVEAGVFHKCAGNAGWHDNEIQFGSGFNPDEAQMVCKGSNGGSLWLGNKVAARSFQGDVLCVLEEPHCEQTTRSGYTHCHIMRDGHARRDSLDAAAEHIQAELEAGKMLLVHCGAGMERSPLTIAWWMCRTGQVVNFPKAYEVLRSIRPIVQNREGWIEPAPVAAASSNALPEDDATAATGAALPANATEQQKYEEMWKHKEYRQVAPGEHAAMRFLGLAQPKDDSTIIDFGAGTGRGAFMIALMGKKLHVKMLDFAANCLDESVKQYVQEQPEFLDFKQHDLTQPVPDELKAEYGFCTDVMEHIPPKDVDTVLTNILAAAQHVYFQIACTEDHCGALIGHPLHLTVMPGSWWRGKLEALGCQVHYFEDRGADCIAYVTAWSSGKEISDVGVLNVEEELVKKNVRINSLAGWKQVKPHLPQPKEVMIVGGGPSLNGQLETIRKMRAEGCLLVTLNGAYNWALENGLSVSGTIVVDAREFNARFTHPVMPGVHYLIGSQVDPAVLDGLPHENTYLWNTTAELFKEILDETVGEGNWYGVVGGCTVLLRAIPLLRMLGYLKFHLFGCDSCVTTDAHHAYAQVENDGAPLFPTIVGGRKFMCTAWQIAQAQQFMDLIRVMGDLFELQIHGDGLLSWILIHGANLDIEREEREEATAEAGMK